MGSMSTEGLPKGMAQLTLSDGRVLIGPASFIERIHRDLEMPPDLDGLGDWDFDPEARLELTIERPEVLG